ncbi:MAG: hypothetical protein JXB48_00115 [Candidatus Latescibacteria bacterium]|nr:hypothetical protein [Candidatus Latescibacterota bacterium]
MKITRVGSSYIILVWTLVIVILGSVLYMGFRQNIKDLKLLMMNEAERLINFVGVSAAAGIYALDEVEYLTAQRLLENARLIERLSESGIPHPDTLAQIALDNDLYMIAVLDNNGNVISWSSPLTDREINDNHKHRPEVESVLSGEYDEAVIGFMEDQYYSGKRYGVVVKRNCGGAVVVNTDSYKMLDFRKTVGLGTLFSKIGSLEGVSYITLQDSIGIVAASGGVTEMIRIIDDPFLYSAWKGDGGSRMISKDGAEILEVVRSLVVDEVNLGLVRIGLHMTEINKIRQRALRQFILLFIASIISGAFVLFFTILRQNYLILNAEHDRILLEVRRMEAETRRNERLTSMGQLAAGVAHEIRNPLNAISIITQRIKAEFTTNENQEEYASLLSTIGKEISRISIIVENFLKFARPPKLVMSLVNINELVTDILTITAENAKRKGITIRTFIDMGLFCRCDYDQLKQALLNILLNAFDAIREKGLISIFAVRKDRELELRIEDNGTGIAEDILPKIFDPYFTTRSKGNGLGLSEVHRIVTAHGGRIIAENLDNGGAVFSIYVPINGEKK